MKKTLLVIRQELINTFKRPSYLIVAFGVPLLAVLILGGVKLIQSRSEEDSGTLISTPEEWQMEIEGYVDQSGLIREIPSDLPEGHLLAYDNEDQAQKALASGEISAYYIIPPDYVKTGEIFYVFPDTKALIKDGQKWVMKWTLLVNLLGGDLEAADRIWNPVWDLEGNHGLTSTILYRTIISRDSTIVKYLFVRFSTKSELPNYLAVPTRNNLAADAVDPLWGAYLG